MLYQAIRLGCQKYHQYEYSYDEAYRQYLEDRVEEKWAYPEMLDFDEVNRLVTFANKWKCRMPSDETNVLSILEGLRRAVPKLSLLNDKTVLDVDLGLVIQDMTIRQLISTSFDEIAGAGKRFESVATSKMIHAAVNLELFVMWDTRIASAHRVGANGDNYAHFLTLIQGQIEEAIGQVSIAENLTREGAITSLTPCGHTLAKVIDEFNYVCFTVRDDDVRQLAGYP